MKMTRAEFKNKGGGTIATDNDLDRTYDTSRKLALTEQIILCYYNDYLFSHGAISEVERNKMVRLIDTRLRKRNRDVSRER